VAGGHCRVCHDCGYYERAWRLVWDCVLGNSQGEGVVLCRHYLNAW
jgi:hypothetical protein